MEHPTSLSVEGEEEKCLAVADSTRLSAIEGPQALFDWSVDHRRLWATIRDRSCTTIDAAAACNLPVAVAKVAAADLAGADLVMLETPSHRAQTRRNVTNAR